MKPKHAAIFDPLRQKIETLISLHQTALNENRELKTQIETLSEEIKKHKTEKDILESKVQKLQMAGAFQASSEIRPLSLWAARMGMASSIFSRPAAPNRAKYGVVSAPSAVLQFF